MRCTKARKKAREKDKETHVTKEHHNSQAFVRCPHVGARLFKVYTLCIY